MSCYLIRELLNNLFRISLSSPKINDFTLSQEKQMKENEIQAVQYKRLQRLLKCKDNK
eukprot:Pgem_evm1s12070